MPFTNFEEMFKFYTRRNIFNQHDKALMENIGDLDAFLKWIVEPKLFQGRLNYGDFLRIVAVL